MNSASARPRSVFATPGGPEDERAMGRLGSFSPPRGAERRAKCGDGLLLGPINALWSASSSCAAGRSSSGDAHHRKAVHIATISAMYRV